MQGPVVTVSFPRSGTTLLRAMLHSHPELAVLPEPWWMMDLVKALWRDARPLTRAAAASHLEARVPPAWRRVAELDLSDVVALLPEQPLSGADVVSAVGRAYARRFGKERWGVKYPGVEFRRGIPLLHATFPRATFIFLARDVRDVYLSQLHAGLRNGLSDLYLFSLLWALQARKILRDLRAVGSGALVVRYEDLIEDPGRVLGRICEVAGLCSSTSSIESMLSYQEGVERQILRNPIHRKLAGPVLSENRRRYERELTPIQTRRAGAVAAPVLRELGYVDGEGGAGPRDVAAAALQAALRLGANAIGQVRGKSTLSGIRRDRIGRGRGVAALSPPVAAPPPPPVSLRNASPPE